MKSSIYTSLKKMVLNSSIIASYDKYQIIKYIILLIMLI